MNAARLIGSMATAPSRLSQAAQGGTVVAGARWVGSQSSAHSKTQNQGDVWGWWVAEKDRHHPAIPRLHKVFRTCARHECKAIQPKLSALGMILRASSGKNNGKKAS